MPEQKIKPTEVTVESFLDKVADEQQREDSRRILAMMRKTTGLKPRMWGPSMIGFGEYHYKYDSGHEGDCFLMGFSPRKGQMSLYFMPGLGNFVSDLKRLGKYKTGKACLYIKKLADVDEGVLREMFEKSFAMMGDRTQKNKRAAAAKKPKRKAAK